MEKIQEEIISLTGRMAGNLSVVVSEQSPHDEEISLLDTIGEMDVEAEDTYRGQYHYDDDHDVVDAEESTYRRAVPDQRIREPTSSHRKKKIKNRHVKAAIMIAVVWTVMVTFLIVSLSVDWWKRAWKDISDVCILCGGNGIDDIEEIPMTEWPTRRPSSTQGSSSLFTMLGKQKTLLPPPENIAQVCSPSIYLDHGPEYAGSSVNDKLAVCANACFPGKLLCAYPLYCFNFEFTFTHSTILIFNGNQPYAV